MNSVANLLRLAEHKQLSENNFQLSNERGENFDTEAYKLIRCLLSNEWKICNKFQRNIFSGASAEAEGKVWFVSGSDECLWQWLVSR